MPRLAQQRAAHALLGLGCVLLAAFLVTAVSAGAPLGIPSDLLYDAVVVLGTLVVALRAACVREDRVAWALVAAAICASTAGDLLNSVLYPRAEDLPVPSWCDPLWLGFYPPMLIACGLLARRRRHGLRSGMWLDGVAGALAAAAVVSAALLEPLLADAAPQRTIELLTNVAYPVGDLVVVAALVTTTALAGWQLDRRWLLLITGVLAYVAADGAYLLTAAAGTYVDGGVTDAGWVVAALAFGAAAWAPRAPDADSPAPGRGTVVAPVVFAAIALAVVLQQAFARPYPLTLVLAVATLGVVVGRLTLVHADHQQRLRESRLDAATDELTGLWNRRRLMADLAAAVSDGAQRVLLLLDLDGFKGYNDTFGHPAGDRLLRVIGGHLHDVVARRGTAYRLGGDEFCALLDLGPSEEPMAAGAAVAAAIESRGDGFRVGASFGWVQLPVEATEPSEALRLADHRLYAAKDGGRTSAARQSADVLRALLAARDAELDVHAEHVGALAEAVGRRLGLGKGALRQLRRAAELHDVGKLLLPASLLAKPAGLDAGEWALVRRHTVMGEQILAAAPSLEPAARIVRATHERIDGMGYPDGLGGDAIPLEARIVFVCDAFAAMTSARAYAVRLGAADALAELRRGAGTQFDARVVDAFAAELADGQAGLIRSAPSRSSAPGPAPSR